MHTKHRLDEYILNTDTPSYCTIRSARTEATDVTQSCSYPDFPLQLLLLCLTVSDQHPTVNQSYPFGPWNHDDDQSVTRGRDSGIDG